MFTIQLNFVKLVVLSIWLLLLVAGCLPVAHEGEEIGPVTETSTTEQVESSLSGALVTPTRPISENGTPAFISVPTSSPTPTPPATPIPSQATTITPWPTLSPDEAVNEVLALLADNQNPDCLLPCWWEATPGQTRWQDIHPYLKSFALMIDPFPERSFYVAVFPVPENIDHVGKLNIGYRVDESDIVTEISIASINIKGYDPRKMMTLYGVPDEVWLKTLDAPREGVLPFQLIIAYQQQGISFRYHVNAVTDEGTVTACFEPGVVELERPDLFRSGPRIYLWEPGQYKTIDEIANIPGEIYFTLEEKTDLTLQTLYEKFTNPDEQPCIDTLAELWWMQ